MANYNLIHGYDYTHDYNHTHGYNNTYDYNHINDCNYTNDYNNTHDYNHTHDCNNTHDYNSVLMENTWTRIGCLSFCTVAIFVQPILFYSLVWYDKYSSDDKRTFLNMLSTSLAWLMIEYTLLVQTTEVFRWVFVTFHWSMHWKPFLLKHKKLRFYSFCSSYFLIFTFLHFSSKKESMSQINKAFWLDVASHMTLLNYLLQCRVFPTL